MPRRICRVCGNKRLDEFCQYCHDYHTPEPCTGEGCKICADIRFIRHYEKKRVDKEESM